MSHQLARGLSSVLKGDLATNVPSPAAVFLGHLYRPTLQVDRRRFRNRACSSVTRERTRKEVETAGLMPKGRYGFGVVDIWVTSERGKRHVAAEEVLCSLPPEDYDLLCRKRLAWIAPAKEVHATTKENPGSAYIIYLALHLEYMTTEGVQAIVAHELAHLVLGHQLADCTKEQDERQEREAWAKAAEWGFEKVRLNLN